MVDNSLDEQKTRVQRRLDAFELSLTRQVRGAPAPDLVGIKVEIVELQKLVNELHERPVFHMPNMEDI